MTTNKDLKSLLKRCTQLGCTITKTRGGHISIRLPSGRQVFCASTTGAWKRGVENTRAWLRREGVIV